jgi:microcystin-dependent protein
MAQPYLGEVRMFAGNFAPAGWVFCHGQLLPISENETLFQLIGTTYGGDGQSTFGVPDLRGRLPMHAGNSRVLAEQGGVESVTLTINQIPSHTHALRASSEIGNAPTAAGNVTSNSQGAIPYIEDVPGVAMSPQAIAAVGGNAAHTNVQPFLCVNFILSLFGVFPSPT